MLEIIQFVGGVALLCVGAHWLVTGASSIAIAFGLPKHVVGLTLVAVGTSAPEFFVNVLAALEGKTDFALSNVSGSNLANMCLGFGLCSFVAHVRIRRKEFGSDMFLNWVAPVVVLVMMLANPHHVLSIWAVVPMLFMLAFYAYTLQGRKTDEEQAELASSMWKAFLLFLVGIVGLYFGGEFVLNAAVNTAQELHIHEDVIALTVVALGTSVPDITASVIAASKGEGGIAVGNIVGSNLANILVVLNGTLMVSGQSLMTNDGIRSDYLVASLVAVFCWILAYKLEHVPRWAGGLLICTYISYLTARSIL